jgi:hypothetical protein
MNQTVATRARPSGKQPQWCNATEHILRSGRGAPAGIGPGVRANPVVDGGERVDVGLRAIGGNLGAALSALDPYRHGDDDLHAAYRSVHAAMGDLAAVYCWITLTRRVPPARPARRRRPWGG